MSELSPLSLEQQVNLDVTSPDISLGGPDTTPTSRLRNKLLSAVTAGIVLVGGVAMSEFADSGEAHADTIMYSDLGYPDSAMPCEHAPYNVTGACANYDWGPTHTEKYDDPSENSIRGYGYRNCTDYVAWKESTIGVTVPTGWGNGGNFYTSAPASERSSTPAVGDAAVEPVSSAHPWGHVAFVEAVNGDGTMTVSEYNYDGKGDGDTRTNVNIASSEFTEFVDFGVHSSGGSTPTGNSGPDSTQAFVNHAGEVWARTGVGTDWIREANAGSAAKVASGGGVQALIDDAGEVWARSGIGTDWAPESNQYSAKEISVGSDGTQMIESYDGSVYAKRGVNWGGWVPEANPGSAADIATNGGLQVIRDNAGQLWVKGNSLDWGGFWPETSQYSALQVAISNDGTQVLKSYDGSVYGRANTANSNWVMEANPGSAAEVAIGNGVQVLVDGAGQIWQKGPSVDFGGWAAETNPGSAKNIAVVEDGTQLIQDNADQLWARSTAANSTFVWETSPGVIASLGQ